MALYNVNNGPAFSSSGTMQNVSTQLSSATSGLLSLSAETANTVVKGYIYSIVVGAAGTLNATDCQILWDMSAITAVGTPTSSNLTPVPLDSSDAAARISVDANYTAIPTVTANSSRWGAATNQRATYLWMVNPGGPGELVIPATDEAGHLVRAMSATYASTCFAEVKWRE